MATKVYPQGLLGLLDGSIDWAGATIKIVGVAAGYTYSDAHKFLSDVAGAARVATTAALTGGALLLPLKTATTLSAAAADNSFNDSGNGFVTAGFQVGDMIFVSGFTGNAANNGTFTIATVAAGKITIEEDVLVDDAAGESVTIIGNAVHLLADDSEFPSVLVGSSDIVGLIYYVDTGTEGTSRLVHWVDKSASAYTPDGNNIIIDHTGAVITFPAS